ncbi:hypothetical protein BDR05DRAFT_668912 [Suillus weaverae]|nr:hypothetical protein BDR05DRAFT_668912 [Suillus weaverae]
MSTQADLERADPGPSTDGQPAEKVSGKTPKDAKTTTAENSALVAAWMQRLQTLTLITTFLVSVDGELFTLTSKSSPVSLDATSVEPAELVYSCLSGALIFHTCSAILGYAASFTLVRYEFVDAVHPSDTKTGEISNAGLHHHEGTHEKHLLLTAIPPLYAVQSLLQIPSRLRFQSRSSTPPVDLLTRCYFTILTLSGAGFILALLGIATYAWYGLQRVVGIFTMACLGVSLLSCVWAVVY